MEFQTNIIISRITIGKFSLVIVYNSSFSLIFVVHGPTARTCILKLVSCGADDKVNG